MSVEGLITLGFYHIEEMVTLGLDRPDFIPPSGKGSKIGGRWAYQTVMMMAMSDYLNHMRNRKHSIEVAAEQVKEKEDERNRSLADGVRFLEVSKTRAINAVLLSEL